jgi:hypothetical protein
MAKALVEPLAVECGHGPSTAVHSLPIRALPKVDHTQVVIPPLPGGGADFKQAEQLRLRIPRSWMSLPAVFA